MPSKPLTPRSTPIMDRASLDARDPLLSVFNMEPTAARTRIGVRLSLMKKLLVTSLASIALGDIAAAPVFATTYNYSYTFTPVLGTNWVSGSFDGTANGDLITDLSNITAVLNGFAPFNGSGSLWGSHYDAGTGGWVSGGAVASFDGLQNNFLFIDSNFPLVPNYSNYYYSVYSLYHINDLFFESGYVYDLPLTSGIWSVTAANPIPEPSSMALLGASLIGLGVNRRRGKIRNTKRQESGSTASA